MTPAMSAEQAQALPMPLHHLARDEDGRATATCDAPEGSACRLVCAEDCGAEAWPCGSWDYDRDQEREAHPMRDGGYCNVVLYLNGDGDASDLIAVEGDPAGCTYAGPVLVRWEDDFYVWEPTEVLHA